MKPCEPLTRILIAPTAASQMALHEWDLLIRQARHANLLGRLASSLASHRLLGQIPEQPRPHIDAALMVAERQTRAVRWEVDRILAALAHVPTPVILLKGAAYVVQDLPAARGRMFSDVDIMVPKRHLDAVEMALKLQGWITTHHDAYDQRYYRTWMHELPPMRHITRQTMLDVHHTILPETARVHPDPEKLLAAAISVNGHDRLKVLAPADMVLHSATHLFHDGELEHGLRDLVDLDSLLRHFSSKEDGFWTTLVARAQSLDLSRPLFYALRYTARVLDTPVPTATLQSIRSAAPAGIMLRLMDALFLRAFRPHHPSCADWLTKPALWMLFVRAHWLRMPFPLLLRHLLHKALFPPKQPA
jgi:hypothetical protein